MTLATEALSVILFTPSRSLPFFDDEGTGDVILYFGQVRCVRCGLAVDVSTEADKPTSGYCPHNCGNQITVEVDPEHFRMDDSRPAESGHGCICGDRECRWWEVA